MKRVLFKIISSILVITHLSLVCLWDVSFADAGDEAVPNAQPDTTQIPEEKPAETLSAEETSQPQEGKSATGSSSGSMPQTKSSSFNFSALQSFQNDPFTGKATFSIPIGAPAARNGIGPGAALTYSSGAANGIVGVGWNLELGSIERSTRKGTANYDSDDTYVVNSSGGASGLVKASDSSSHYRMEIEGAFTKFSFNGTYWQASDKSGTQYYFGQDTSSRQEYGSKVFKWCLDKVVDRHGNYMSLSYTKEQNQIYIQKISYSGNQDENLSHPYSMEFGWDSGRSDSIISYRAGFRVVTSQRLSGIKVKYKGSLVRSYGLEYGSSQSDRSLLSSVTASGYSEDGSVTSLPEISFSYQEQVSGWQESSSGYSIPVAASFDSGCVIADINNDAYQDIVRGVYGEEHKTFLYDTSASSWKESSSWQVSPHIWSYTGDQGLRFTDINGDGWVDWVQNFITKEGTAVTRINLNNKQNGWDTGSWSFPDDKYIIVAKSNCCQDWHEYQGVILSDINADGYADYVICRSDSHLTYLNNKAGGFSEKSSWAIPEGDFRDGTQLADVNGDGLPDLVIASSNLGKKTYLNSAPGWVRESGLDLPEGNLSDGSAQLADINNDGLADLLINKGSSQRTTYLNTGSSWKRASEWDMPAGDFTGGSRLLDLDADGLVDFMHHPSDSVTTASLNPGPYPELLSRIDNGIGGSLSVSYQPSTKYANTGEDSASDLSFPVYVVTKVTVSDGRGDSYSSTYEYKDGLFDFDEREFRGFGYCKASDDDGNTTESYFHQDKTRKGRLKKQLVKDSSGRLYAKTENTWSYKELYSGINFVYISEVDSYSYDADGSSAKQSRVAYEYDSYGNSAKVIFYGDTAEDGDEKTQVNEYTYNETEWIVGLPKYTKLLDSDGDIVSQKWFYYDGADSYDTSPVNGLLTKEEAWLYNPEDKSEKKAYVSYAYDAYGNPATVTNYLTRDGSSVSYSATTEYDSQVHIYPIKATNALGQSISSTYDYRIGQALTTTDANNQTTTNTYDGLGRLISVSGPKDSEDYPGARYSYDFSVSPLKITQEVKSVYSPEEYLTSYYFYDGLGRLIETKSPAQETTRQIVSGVVAYNSRGMVKERYLPYFVESGGSFSSPERSGAHFSFSYDALGRLTQTTNPDSSSASSEYSGWTVTRTDEEGNYITSRMDAYGRIILVDEHNEGSTYSTNYDYDTQGNLTKITDAGNNVTEITHDSLGRKIKMNDPDMGEWSYGYDELGNLIKQTDAKGQVLEFEYDDLRRLTKKKVTSPESQTLAAYSYDDTSKDYCQGRLSKITDQSGESEFWYDALGREIKSVKTVSGVSYKVERGYDPLDRLVSLKYPDSATIEYEYSPQGPTRVTNTFTDREYVKAVTYNVNNQIERIEYGNGAVTNYTYDENTLRLKQLQTEGAENRLQDLTYEFYSNGNVKSITDAVNSNSQGFTYDNLNRLSYASGIYGSISYKYDSIGNITAAGDKTYSYGSSRPHALTALSDGTSLEYDANGNLRSRTSPDSKTSNYTYDYENRLTEVAPDPSNKSTSASVSLTLKPGWNFFALPVVPEDLEISSVFSGISSGYSQVSRYNPEKDKFEHYVKDADFNQFSSFEYGRGYQVYISSSSNVSLTISGKAPTEQIKKSLEKGWNLIGCPSNDIVSVTNALNNLERHNDYDSLQEYYPEKDSYIEMGEGVNMSVGEAYFMHCLKDASWKLPYNEDNSTATTTFTYDGDGGRVKKYVSSSATTTTYIGSLYEEDSDDASRKHIYLGANRLLTLDGLLEARYYHSDHLGSSNVISDNDGKELQHIEYYPFGAAYQSEGSQVISHKYTGKEEDVSTGLYFYGARYYEPELGRFTQPDTIVPNPYNPQDLNRYSYCNNNPINYTDPTGHSWKSFWKRWGGFSGAFAKAVFTGDWKGFANTMITTGTAFVFSGFNPVVAAATYMTESVMDTEAGWRATEGVGKGLFDNVFGMRPGTAYIWSAITLRIGVNLGFETMFANMVGDPAAGSRPYDPKNPSDKALTDNPKGYKPFGRYPGRKGHPVEFINDQVRTLTDRSNNTLAVTGIGTKSGGLVRIGLDPQHTGAIAKNFSGQGMKAIAPDWMYASLYGTCQQATNATLLAGGISDTVLSLYPHWSTFASTAIYGNYGGGLVRSVAAGVQANENYER